MIRTTNQPKKTSYRKQAAITVTPFTQTPTLKAIDQTKILNTTQSLLSTPSTIQFRAIHPYNQYRELNLTLV